MTDKELECIMECIAHDFPGAVDYNILDPATDQEYAEVLDKDDNRIGVISEQQLTRYVNWCE